MYLPTITSLDELADLLARDRGLFVRWSHGPDADAGATSSDELTGTDLPGLSANPLDVEQWWEDRPVRLWVARRIHDYEHLGRAKGPGVRPWVLRGREIGRGPDNEPLVECLRPIAWIGEEVTRVADALVREQGNDWGPLDRHARG